MGWEASELPEAAAVGRASPELQMRRMSSPNFSHLFGPKPLQRARSALVRGHAAASPSSSALVKMQNAGCPSWLAFCDRNALSAEYRSAIGLRFGG